MSKAVFLDRDGTLVSLVYDIETGYIDSITRPEQIRLIPKVDEALKCLKENNYKLILVSNQPALAKGRVDESTFWKTQREFEEKLKESSGVELDGVYFCLHHPQASVAKYRCDCECRKPKPGLIIKAAKEHNISLSESYMVGDDILDIKAGSAAGCRTIILGHANATLMEILEREGLKPDGIAANLYDAARQIILSQSNANSDKQQADDKHYIVRRS